MPDKKIYRKLAEELKERNVLLVAVSKTRSVAEIQELYDAGHRDFGENRVSELIEKIPKLPEDIKWHFIGNLQSKKVKDLLPHPWLIHSVDRVKLLKVLQKEAEKANQKVRILIQLKIAREESKSGFDQDSCTKVIGDLLMGTYPNIELCGLMAMATFTEDEDTIEREFRGLEDFFLREKEKSAKHNRALQILSIGMSNDYRIAVKCSSNMVRIGSMIFGERNY